MSEAQVLPDQQPEAINFVYKNDTEIAQVSERFVACLELLSVDGAEVNSVEIEAILAGEEGEIFPCFLLQFAELYSLDRFECRVILLCLLANVDSDICELAREAHGVDTGQSPITVSLAFSLFQDGGHHHFLASSRLVEWRLIEVIGAPLYEAVLELEPVVLGYLISGEYREPSFSGLISSLSHNGLLTESQLKIAETLMEGLLEGAGVVQLVGRDRLTLRAIASNAGKFVGLKTSLMSCLQLPVQSEMITDVAIRWRRYSFLENQILVIDASDMSPFDRDFPVTSQLLRQFVELAGPSVILLSEERVNFHIEDMITLETKPPYRSELASLWQQVLYKNRCFLMAELFGDEEKIYVDDREDQILAEELSVCFAFSVPDIEASNRAFYRRVKDVAKIEEEREELLLPIPWKECWWQCAREQARPSFDGLARRIEADAAFSSLVTDRATENTLREIIAQFSARSLVRGEWGMEPVFQRGTGITVLFAGASGTGKTLAAEVLAKELSLDLYQIDLSQMVSKYIGETQKNLSRVFDAAERGGSILLFDEADALFSKRTDVKDSKDRHANMEVGFLLQRMEAYSGIAILTSNLKDSIDDAFLRRLQYVVDFPFPSAEMRGRLWETMMPISVPIGDLPDPEKFAKLTLSGAQIRNVIRRAVYRAASETGCLELGHILHAAQAEMEKSDRALTIEDLERLLTC